MTYYEQTDQWAYLVKPQKGGGWLLVLIDGGRALDIVRTFPAGDEGHEQAIDAGQEWLWSEERGMGLQSPMEAAGKVAAHRVAASKR
jgi:hypothetical protein